MFLSASMKNVEKSPGGYERCTVVLRSKTLAMSLNAPMSDYDVAFKPLVRYGRCCGRQEAWNPSASSLRVISSSICSPTGKRAWLVHELTTQPSSSRHYFVMQAVWNVVRRSYSAFSSCGGKGMSLRTLVRQVLHAEQANSHWSCVFVCSCCLNEKPLKTHETSRKISSRSWECSRRSRGSWTCIDLSAGVVSRVTC